MLNIKVMKNGKDIEMNSFTYINVIYKCNQKHGFWMQKSIWVEMKEEWGNGEIMKFMNSEWKWFNIYMVYYPFKLEMLQISNPTILAISWTFILIFFLCSLTFVSFQLLKNGHLNNWSEWLTWEGSLWILYR